MADSIRSPLVVVGAGVMGRGIAYVGAVAGAEVRLVDLDEDVLDAAIATIDRDLVAGVSRGKVSPDGAERARDLVTPTSDLAGACDGAAIVIEAVVEQMPVKHDVLRVVDGAAPSDAVVATNTSAMSVTEIMSALGDPSRGCGMHFFNPVPRMKLCELIVGLHTSDTTLAAARAVAEAMGKQTVTVKDLPGFATSRLNALIGNEGMRMLADGVASADDIDTAARLGLNHPMGPLEMGDLVGWDTRLDILEYLADELGERFRPTDLQRALVAAGRLGRKSGRGIYRYDDEGNRTDDPADLDDLR